MNTREQIMDTARAITTLPPMAVELVSVLQDPDADVEHIAGVLEHDAALAANVLKLANSAAMGGRGQVRSIKQAVVRLGLRKTTELVLEVAVAPHAGRAVGGYDLPPGALWEHSAAVAIATDVLAEHHQTQPPIEAFTAGLLHDIGKLVLGHFVEVDFEPIRTLAFEQGLSFEQAERQVLGIDHAEVGAALLSAWGLDGPLREAVRWHHEPEHAPDQAKAVVDLVHAAVQIVTAAGIGGGADGTHYQTSQRAIRQWGVRPKLVERVLSRTMQKLRALQELNPQTIGSHES